MAVVKKARMEEMESKHKNEHDVYIRYITKSGRYQLRNCRITGKTQKYESEEARPNHINS